MDYQSEIVVEAGIYTWCLNSSELYADTAVAHLFGLDGKETAAGLPIEKYVDRIHEEDKDRVAAAISQALAEGSSHHVQYRIVAHGSEQWVVSLGICLKDRDGNPVSFAGIIYPLDELQVLSVIGSNRLAS